LACALARLPKPRAENLIEALEPGNPQGLLPIMAIHGCPTERVLTHAFDIALAQRTKAELNQVELRCETTSTSSSREFVTRSHTSRTRRCAKRSRMGSARSGCQPGGGVSWHGELR
jgi:hypothetical protein